MSRMESKELKGKAHKNNKSLQTMGKTENKKNFIDLKRPSTSYNVPSKISNLNSAFKAFKQEKQLTEKALSEFKKENIKSNFETVSSVK